MDTYPRPNRKFNGSFSILSPTWVVCLLLIFMSLVWSCQAQGHSDDDDGGLSVPAVIFTVITGAMCFIFWMCFILICNSRNRCNTTPLTSPIHFTYDAQPSSTTYPGRPQTHARDYGQPHSKVTVESRFPALSTVLYSPPTSRPGYNSSQAESASIPEATLHQSDAPPAYEEAIRMTTVTEQYTTA